ncbi:MAG TPA: type II toxin-antitoxin system VapC family toxin [Solirubrobacteraceae bacterium]
MTVLDASVLIAYFGREDTDSAKAIALLGQADELAASTITFAEVLVGATRLGRGQEQLSALDDLGVVETPILAGGAAALAELRVATGLRMPDCCVLHAADVNGAAAVATFDEQLAKAARQRGYRTSP